jgi:hypothetical protein
MAGSVYFFDQNDPRQQKAYDDGRTFAQCDPWDIQNNDVCTLGVVFDNSDKPTRAAWLYAYDHPEIPHGWLVELHDTDDPWMIPILERTLEPTVVLWVTPRNREALGEWVKLGFSDPIHRDISPLCIPMRQASVSRHVIPTVAEPLAWSQFEVREKIAVAHDKYPNCSVLVRFPVTTLRVLRDMCYGGFTPNIGGGQIQRECAGAFALARSCRIFSRPRTVNPWTC